MEYQNSYSMERKKIITLMQDMFPSTLAPFEYNGLLTNLKEKNITHMGFTLGFSQKSISLAIAKKIDFLVIHNAPEKLIPQESAYYYSLEASIKKNALNIYRLHLPLDFAKNGIIDTLCQNLGLQGIPAKLQYENGMINGGVYVAKAKITVVELVKRVKKLKPKTIRIVRGRKQIVESIAIASGDGCKPEFLLQLLPDVFICGLFNQESIRIAMDLGITLIEATSYATENHSLRQVVQNHKRIFKKIPVTFLDINNDVEAYA